MIRFLLSLFFMFCLSGCDFQDPLSGRYVFYHDAADYGYIIHKDGHMDGDPHVPCNVVGFDFDRDFIVARQLVTAACLYEGTEVREHNDYGQREGEIAYWIIDVKQHKHYGPLTEQNFYAKRKELEVDDSLWVYELG